MLKAVTFTKFARMYGVSLPMVSRYVRLGQITKRSLVRHGGRWRIIPNLAAADLDRNLDPIRRKGQLKKRQTISDGTSSKTRMSQTWDMDITKMGTFPDFDELLENTPDFDEMLKDVPDFDELLKNTPDFVP